MSREQLEEIREAIEGIVAGRIMDIGGVSRTKMIEISRNAGAYTVGQLKEFVGGPAVGIPRLNSPRKVVR